MIDAHISASVGNAPHLHDMFRCVRAILLRQWRATVNSWRWNHARLCHLEVIRNALYAHAVIQSKSLPPPGAKDAAPHEAPHVVARFPRPLITKNGAQFPPNLSMTSSKNCFMSSMPERNHRITSNTDGDHLLRFSVHNPREHRRAGLRLPEP